ncbi:hypothetical protein ABZV60_29910 [Streptomyces sp. NPDC004787]
MEDRTEHEQAGSVARKRDRADGPRELVARRRRTLVPVNGSGA